MASFKALFVTDKTMESEGVWHILAGGPSVKVARTGTPEYKATLRRLAAPHKTIAEMLIDSTVIASEADTKLFKDIEAQAMSEHVLLDWKGFTETDEPNSPQVPYSQEKALEYINASEDFRKLILGLATAASNFKSAEGNSGRV